MVARFLEPLVPLGSTSTGEERQWRSLRAGQHPPAAGKLNGFSIQHQLQDNWCWAAVSTSVATYYGSAGWTQCKVASAATNYDCCNPAQASDPTMCNVYGFLDSALTTVGHFARLVDGDAGFGNLKTEVSYGRPLGCRVAWVNDQGAHFVAISGWSSSADGVDYLDVEDPFYSFVQIPYSQFVSGYRQTGDTWSHSYFTARNLTS